MKKLRNSFAYLVILSSFPFIWWLIYHSASQTFKFWEHGVEKQAMVVALDHVSSSTKSGFGFYYTLDIEGRTLVKGFRRQVPISSSVSVLVLSDQPTEDEVVVGTKNSSLFALFSNVVGGNISALIFLVVFAPLTVASPFLLVKIVKGRKRFIET